MGSEAEETSPRPKAPGKDRDAGQMKANCRSIFREMVRIEIEDRPLNWRRRRELIRYGQSIGMEVFEAALIVRAVEYACGHVSLAAMDEIETPANIDYIPPVSNPSELSRSVLTLSSALLLSAIALRLLHAWLH